MTKVLAACAAALYLPLAHAQAGGHAHQAPRTDSPKPAPAATTGAAAGQPGTLYSSPFADYRAFKADEPLKDWRKANDEVREAGGHIGLMKQAPEQHQGHGAHGAKPPAAMPPAKK